MHDRHYLQRCLDLAKLGGSKVRPNPMVGAVILYKGKILGEGYHKEYGGPHAEVNAVNSVKIEDQYLLTKSTLYVSLEPCCHSGKTPPCTDLIIRHKIPKVVIAQLDPSEKVHSKGVQKLQDHGIEVKLIEMKHIDHIAEFKAVHIHHRPFVQLKFAKSKDNYLGISDKQVWLSNDISSIYSHRLRANTDAILVGTNTAVIDNPSLTLRNYPGKAPLRIVLDRTGRIPKTHALLSDNLKTLVITETHRKNLNNHKMQWILDFESENFVDELLSKLLNFNIYHLLIEGGASMHKTFISKKIWDEAVIIQTEKILESGIKAPHLNGRLKKQYTIDNNEIFVVSPLPNDEL
ncbi:MAG: bifunctional diaminohydroxyphosphoribosylaminopyrimidine deaminase/5-amino-6-(5-phosphoribosylamino)uracil reductase RibD [Saprospiraceae bacterium]|nr:bifunctional diaminohydroxyphosphoribosylaminopyrimidine deaminase/5-amino-6-(5-phosphoribosylamino)uracil reductase RibD [Saprospiraceae bacterium]